MSLLARLNEALSSSSVSPSHTNNKESAMNTANITPSNVFARMNSTALNKYIDYSDEPRIETDSWRPVTSALTILANAAPAPMYFPDGEKRVIVSSYQAEQLGRAMAIEYLWSEEPVVKEGWRVLVHRHTEDRVRVKLQRDSNGVVRALVQKAEAGLQKMTENGVITTEIEWNTHPMELVIGTTRRGQYTYVYDLERDGRIYKLGNRRNFYIAKVFSDMVKEKKAWWVHSMKSYCVRGDIPMDVWTVLSAPFLTKYHFVSGMKQGLNYVVPTMFAKEYEGGYHREFWRLVGYDWRNFPRLAGE